MLRILTYQGTSDNGQTVLGMFLPCFGNVAKAVANIKKVAQNLVEKPTHVAPVRRFHLTLDTIFILTHIAKI